MEGLASNDDLNRDTGHDRAEAREEVNGYTVHMELESLEEEGERGRLCIAKVQLINLPGEYLVVHHILETVEEKVV